MTHHMDPILGLYTTTPSTGGVLSVLTHLRASTITVSNYNNYRWYCTVGVGIQRILSIYGKR